MMGVRNPVDFADTVTDILSRMGTEVWRQAGIRRRGFGYRQEDAGAHRQKRAALKLPVYDATRFGASGDDEMKVYVELPLEQQMAEIYG